MREMIPFLEENQSNEECAGGVKEIQLDVQCITNHSPYDFLMTCHEQEIDDKYSLITVTELAESWFFLNNYDLKSDNTYDILTLNDTLMGLKGNLVCTYYEDYNTGAGLMTGIISFNGNTGTFCPSANGSESYKGGITISSVSGVLKKCPINDFGA